MPAASTTQDAYQWRDSWPPAQLHLQQGHDFKDGNADDSHDDNPMAYFLTPMTPPLLAVDDDDDEDYSYGYGFGYSTGLDTDMGMDFDAGIEDDSQPAMDIRSVSPSVLAENILSPGFRPPTPPKASESEDEDYVYDGFTFGYTFGHAPIKIANTNNNRRGKTVTRKGGQSSLSSLSSTPRSFDIPRRRSPRSWRVPSPDVFMIEEEPEEDVSEIGLSRSAAATPASDILPAPGYAFTHEAKPAKRVRFVLP